MIDSTLPTNFYISLTKFLLHAKQQVIAVSAEFGLSSMQALTLLILDDEPLPMNAFRKMYDCDASNITGIIDGLEEKKLVSRQPHLDDRRIKVIRIEAAGRHIRNQIIDRLTAQTTELFTGLSKTETTQLAALITKVAGTS